MATTYNIVEKRYNGTDYDTLYPATKGENLVSPVPVELGGTGGTTGAAGMKNLLDALSTVTPTGTDLLPLKDVSGNIAGKATVDSILSLVSGGAKIQTGSYVGTGTYGQANPCSLTFSFTPKFIIIYAIDTTNETGNFLFENFAVGIAGYMLQVKDNSYTYANKITYDTNKISWYTQIDSTVDGPRRQLNLTDYRYCWTAIG